MLKKVGKVLLMICILLLIVRLARYIVLVREKTELELLSSNYYDWGGESIMIRNEFQEDVILERRFMWKNNEYRVIPMTRIKDKINGFCISENSVGINEIGRDERFFKEEIVRIPIRLESYYLLESKEWGSIVIIIPRCNYKKPARPFAFCLEKVE